MDTATLLGLGSIVIAALALLVSDKQRRYQKTRDTGLDVITLVQRISKLEASNELAWKMIEMHAGKILHHPETPHIDWYIDKNAGQGLTDTEAREFADILKELVDTSPSQGERTAATLMLAAISFRYHLI